MAAELDLIVILAKVSLNLRWCKALPVLVELIFLKKTILALELRFVFIFCIWWCNIEDLGLVFDKILNVIQRLFVL